MQRTCTLHVVCSTKFSVCITIFPLLTADPAVFITPTVQYVLEGESVSVEAGIFASNTPTVQWYHRGQLLNIDSDPHIIQTISENLYILTISPVTNQRLGEYTVEVTLAGQSESDSVTLSYPSE